MRGVRLRKCARNHAARVGLPHFHDHRVPTARGYA
jgi:hypothetical protein